jgi:uncharacterized protein (DUF58 family)
MAARERIYILFHWYGCVFGFLVILVFAAGYVVPTAAGLVQTLGISLVVAGVVALIQSNDNLRGIEILHCRADPAPAGGEVRLLVTVRNTSARERVGLTVRTGWRVRPKVSAWLPVLDAGATATVTLPLPAGRRGVFPVPQLWVCTVRPMGLCFSWKVFRPDATYAVFPRPRGRPLERENADDGKGENGRNDVTGHRAYVPGDVLNRIDWRVYARSGKLAVRTLEEGAEEQIRLRWADTRFLEDPEQRLEQLSRWVDQCVAEGRPFVLDLGAERPEWNHLNPNLCREALAVFQPPDER